MNQRVFEQESQEDFKSLVPVELDERISRRVEVPSQCEPDSLRFETQQHFDQL